MDAFQLLQVSVLWVPFAIMVLTELAKQLPVVPVSSKTAKLFALVLALAGTIGFRVYAGTFDAGQWLLITGEVVANYLVAVGFYESLKKLWLKIWS